MTGSDLYYEVHGDNGPFLLLVHGLLSSKAQWVPNLESLMEFCRPVVVELFGHGRSPSPDNPECYFPENYAMEFEKIRNALGTKKWFVCGQSMGACLTLNYSILFPESVIAQAFTNSLSALSDMSGNKYAMEVVDRIDQEGRKIIDAFKMHPAKSRHMPEHIKYLLLEDIERLSLQGFKNTMAYTAMNIRIHKLLGRIRVPTLLIAGRFEKRFTPFIEVAKASIPNLAVLVADGGHAVNIDAADQFNQALRRLINGAQRESSGSS